MTVPEGNTPPAESVQARVHKVQSYSLGIFGADLITAAIVGVTASIPISIIDYSIMARVSGVAESSSQELLKGCRTLVLRPQKFFFSTPENRCAPVFRLCTTVYFFTYLASNSTKSFMESHGFTKDQVYLGAGIVSGAVNTLLTVWKDSCILSILPPKDAAHAAHQNRPVPMLSRGLFMFRDILTCLAAFTVAPMLADRWRANPPKWLPMGVDDSSQIITPAVLQVVTSFIHITGIRYRVTYPRFDAADLVKSIRDTYVQATTLRIVRIIPAFGLGGIFNREMRRDLLDVAEPQAASFLSR